VVLGLGVLVSALVVRGIVLDRKASVVRPPAPWAASLAPVDDALKARDVSAAVKAWQPVYAAALRDHGWEGLIAVGDARVRIARAAGAARNAHGQARQIYLTALVRAQRDGSVEGAVRAATAFAALGDREIAAEAVRIAAALEARRAVVHASDAHSL
jgi:hypothetical protein